MKNIYGYARVSSKDQNPLRQAEALKNAGVREENIYSDFASGKDFKRSEYRKLIACLRAEDLLVIKSIDRLGRSYEEILAEWKYITKELQAHIKVIDLPLLDTTIGLRDLTGTFISDIVLQILSYVAEQERTNIRQRQAEGIALAKAKGVRFGRPKICIPSNFNDVYVKWQNKEITFIQALEQTGLKQSTFFKLAGEINI